MAKNKIKGYHGTTQQNALQILYSQKFKESNTKQEWLGRGAYFFEYPDSAKWWVSRKPFRYSRKRILVATLEYEDVQLINLDDPAQLRDFNEMVAFLVDKFAADGDPVSFDFNSSSDIEKWCFACNLIKEYDPRVGIIMYTFSSKDYNYTTGFRTNHRQFCVSEPSIITEIEEM